MCYLWSNITQYICFICLFYPVICVLIYICICIFAHPAKLIIMYFIDSEVTPCSAKGFERSPIADPSLLNAPCNQALPICSMIVIIIMIVKIIIFGIIVDHKNKYKYKYCSTPLVIRPCPFVQCGMMIHHNHSWWSPSSSLSSYYIDITINTNININFAQRPL